MTTVLPSLVLALLCLLRAGAEVPVQLDFNMGKFAGRWHIAAAISNCPVFLSMKDKMKSSIATISFTPEGHLAMEWGTFGPGPCVASPDRALSGVLSENQEKTDLRVMETDYQHYAIVYTLRDRGQEPRTMLQLYSGSRKQDVSPQLLQKFKELSHSVGLTEDMLAILPQSGECQGWGWPARSLCTGRLHRCLGLSTWEHTHGSLSV
uniref:Lipocalin/cytosolic fatty-acid binding domain-containing protein n=1 Tax=Anser brachyrhynchus TaxID=132585 RepID=A0A8B9CL75_9AVES